MGGLHGTSGNAPIAPAAQHNKKQAGDDPRYRCQRLESRSSENRRILGGQHFTPIWRRRCSGLALVLDLGR